MNTGWIIFIAVVCSAVMVAGAGVGYKQYKSWKFGKKLNAYANIDTSELNRFA